MFEKLVSGLPYSPALVGQLGFYARRLKKEEITRRTGLIFTVLALVVQSFAVFSPPEPANAANPSDLIRGGVNSIEQIIAVYDQSANGKGDFKAIMDYNGITRGDLQAMKAGKVNSRQFGNGTDTIISWGRVSRFSSSQGQVQHNIPVKDGSASTVYSVPLWRFDSTSYTIPNGSTYQAFIGTTSTGKWFAIQKACGNLMTRSTPQPHPAGALIAADCRTIRGYAYDARQRDAKVKVYLYLNGPPGSGERVGPIAANESSINSPVGQGYGFNVPVPDKFTKLGKPVAVHGVMIPLAGWNQSSVQIGSATIPGNCYTPPAAPEQPAPTTPTIPPVLEANVVKGKEVKNLTQNIADANGSTAAQGDRLEYTIFMENVGSKAASVTMEEELADVLEYASLQDYGNGQFDDQGKVLNWGALSIGPNEKQVRKFVVQVNQIPATPQGTSQPGSYDCVMNNVFGNAVTVNVNCPVVKNVEQTVKQLPATGPTENIIFASSILMVVTYFYARSRQLGREVRLIRQDFNAGTL